MLTQLISAALAVGSGLAPIVGAGVDLPDSSSVRQGFNAAKGKVRIVMLVSPT